MKLSWVKLSKNDYYDDEYLYYNNQKILANEQLPSI